MTLSETQAKTIDGRARTVRELLDKVKYAIDFYQREYAWQERQVRELIDDLTGKFLDSYEPGHSRHEVEGYGHYFLGSIVISHKRGQRFVVDGQQRLTTLTLLLIHLHRLQGDRDERIEVQNLVYSEKYGRKSFNLDIPDRVEVMRVATQITVEIQHKAGRALCSAWDDLSSLDEVVEGRAGDVQDFGNGGL